MGDQHERRRLADALWGGLRGGGGRCAALAARGALPAFRCAGGAAARAGRPATLTDQGIIDDGRIHTPLLNCALVVQQHVGPRHLGHRWEGVAGALPLAASGRRRGGAVAAGWGALPLPCPSLPLCTMLPNPLAPPIALPARASTPPSRARHLRAVKACKFDTGHADRTVGMRAGLWEAGAASHLFELPARLAADARAQAPGAHGLDSYSRSNKKASDGSISLYELSSVALSS